MSQTGRATDNSTQLETWAPSVEVSSVRVLLDALHAADIDARAESPLAGWTTFGVGGPAAISVEPADVDTLRRVLVVADDVAPGVPRLTLGRGSNVLIADAGFPGLVLRLGKGFRAIVREGGDVVVAGAGAALPTLAAWCAREGLAGLEFAAGIPGSVGGAVRMNAGAHGSDVAGRLLSAEVVTSGGAITTLTAASLGFAYRHAQVPPGSVVVAARWRLDPADPAVVTAALSEMRAYRRRTQPLRERNCGSVFTNPPGESAGRIIEGLGLKGLHRGGARVSRKHANFIVVDSTATAQDVYALTVAVRAAVVAAGGPLLTPEVRLIGAFQGAP